MPFTISHVAAVLPFRGKAGRGLPLAALAAGSMSPDLPYFQPFVDWRLMSPPTHTVAGILTWDLLFAVAMWAAWRLGAEPLHDLAPNVIRARWRPARWPTNWRAWLLVLPAVLIGAVTHVLWDAFTHAGRFGATHIPALGAIYLTPLGLLPGYRLLQYASGVIGLTIVIWFGLRQPVRDLEPRRHPSLAVATAWLVPIAALAAATIRVAALDGAAGLRAQVFAAITGAMGAAAAVLILLIAVHAFASSRQRAVGLP